jgi:hypothetical protein
MWGCYKDLNFFEYFYRENEAFSRISRLFKYIFNGIEAFFAMSLWPFVKFIAAEAYWPQPTPGQHVLLI